MKKVILTALVAVASLSASAQMWIGGDLGLGIEKAAKGADNVTTFTVAPEVGYMINENWGVYADIEFTGKTKQPVGTELKTQTSFGFDVAARYVFAKTGIASFFVDGGFGMNFWNNEGGSVFDVKIVPGVAIAASEKVSFVAKLGGLGCAFGNEKAQAAYAFTGGQMGAQKTAFGLNVNNTPLTFGVVYNF